jgi:pimeloyl-ACP methyl ester carboxylesterase
MNHKVEHHRIVANGVSLHYAVAGAGRPLVLMHGFPQTWRQWSPIIERLAASFRLIAPDLRGIGASPGPATGYDKHTMAEDIHAILTVECGDAKPLVCGHDMGSFVAFAYALKYRKAVEGLLLIDAPPPGTSVWAAGLNSPRAYHIAFHSNVDVALMLVTGRERAYISQFINSRAYDASAITPEDIDAYAAAYSAPGALRAAFEMYRALSEDSDLNKKALEDGRLEMPVVLVGGSFTMPRPAMNAVIEEIAVRGRVEVVQRAGHWIAEEQPDALCEIIRSMSNA